MKPLIIEVPSALGLRPDGVQSAPGAVRRAGLHARLRSPDEVRIGVPPLPATPRTRAIALGLGVLFAAIVYGLFKAIDLITVPIAVLTYFIYPLLTGIGAAIFGVERLGWQGMLAALVAFFGLALTIGAYPQHLSIAGLAFAVGAALCRALTCDWIANLVGLPRHLAAIVKKSRVHGSWN